MGDVGSVRAACDVFGDVIQQVRGELHVGQTSGERERERGRERKHHGNYKTSLASGNHVCTADIAKET